MSPDTTIKERKDNTTNSTWNEKITQQIRQQIPDTSNIGLT
jgi:hypothetical protein